MGGSDGGAYMGRDQSGEENKPERKVVCPQYLYLAPWEDVPVAFRRGHEQRFKVRS